MLYVLLFQRPQPSHVSHVAGRTQLNKRGENDGSPLRRPMMCVLTSSSLLDNITISHKQSKNQRNVYKNSSATAILLYTALCACYLFLEKDEIDLLELSAAVMCQLSALICVLLLLASSPIGSSHQRPFATSTQHIANVVSFRRMDIPPGNNEMTTGNTQQVCDAAGPFRQRERWTHHHVTLNCCIRESRPTTALRWD